MIAIEQKTTSKNPRSTVGTITEIYDYLRLLYSRVSDAYSSETNEKMTNYSEDEILELIIQKFIGKKISILSPVVKSRKGHYRELFSSIIKQGFIKTRVDGEIKDLTPGFKLDRYKTHDIEIVVDRMSLRSEESCYKRLKESITTALYQHLNERNYYYRHE